MKKITNMPGILAPDALIMVRLRLVEMKNKFSLDSALARIIGEDTIETRLKTASGKVFKRRILITDAECSIMEKEPEFAGIHIDTDILEDYDREIENLFS